MSPVALLTLGLVIGANNLATALALGALGQAERRLRIVVVFAFFEFTVPLVGMWLGQRASASVTRHLGWLGPALLVGLGLYSLLQSARSTDDDEELAERATTMGGLVILALTLSLDNLVVGFSFGLGESPPLVIATTIAVSSAVFTFFGVTVGSESRRHWEQPAEFAAGVLLVGLGVLAAVGWI